MTPQPVSGLCTLMKGDDRYEWEKYQKRCDDSGGAGSNRASGSEVYRNVRTFQRSHGRGDVSADSMGAFRRFPQTLHEMTVLRLIDAGIDKTDCICAAVMAWNLSFLGSSGFSMTSFSIRDKKCTIRAKNPHVLIKSYYNMNEERERYIYPFRHEQKKG